MAVIQRPAKEGNATTYQGKVAAGYTKILASEVDADIDTIYAAWNAGVDTVNIKAGAVTAACLAPNAVTGSALAPGSITNAALAAGSVNSSNIVNGTIVGADIAASTITDSLIANVAWTKLIAPLIGALQLTPGVALVAESGMCDLWANNVNMNGYNAAKPSWLIRLDFTGDQFTVYRAPAGSSSYTALLWVTNAGVLNASYPAGFVNRGLLGVNAVNSGAVFVNAPNNFQLTTTGWTTFATLPAFTTRGGYVHLWSAASLTVVGPAGGGYAWQRWLCDGGAVIQTSQLISSTAYVPLPNLSWLHNPAAGSHTYVLQVAVDPNMTMMSGANASGGGLLAVEIG